MKPLTFLIKFLQTIMHKAHGISGNALKIIDNKVKA
jgi:hypothetical protein